MRGIPSSGIFLFIFFILAIEALAYFGVAQLVVDRKVKKKVSIMYWLLTAILFGIWLFAFINPDKIRQTTNYQFFYFVISISVLNIFPKLLIAFFVIVGAPFRFLKNKSVSKTIVLSGLILGMGMLLNIGYGILVGRKSIRIEETEISINSLPKSLDQLKIVHISDLHLGSFEDDSFLAKCAVEINKIEPDLILFTGDIVNNYANEMLGFEEQLSAMKSTYGKFAILGNHDYGDYSDWDSEMEKGSNQMILRQKLQETGFNLLLNQSEMITANNTPLYIIGVENWGHSPFPQYAELDSALNNTTNDSFKILMTHDPSHWEEEVLRQKDIQLTLSGHTHGGQFAFKVAGIEFSPMILIQKYWGGLYKKDNQYLYINRGIGCVGFLGRIDMDPEISVLTLKSN